MTNAMKVMHIRSRKNPKALLAAINNHQLELWWSWQLSNSLINIFSALNARIVDNPSMVDDI